jgi:hypothetical protein
MSEKVKLPKDVCDALDLVQKVYEMSPASIVMAVLQKEHDYDDRIKVLNKQYAGIIMRALVLGYEPELSAEEKLKNLYMEYEIETEYCNGVQNGIIKTLEMLEIQYDWMEDAE